jgi:hypothetical protein
MESTGKGGGIITIHLYNYRAIRGKRHGGTRPKLLPDFLIGAQAWNRAATQQLVKHLPAVAAAAAGPGPVPLLAPLLAMGFALSARRTTPPPRQGPVLL